MVRGECRHSEECKRVRFHASVFANDFPEVQGATRFSSSKPASTTSNTQGATRLSSSKAGSTRSNSKESYNTPSAGSRATKSRVSEPAATISFFQDSVADIATTLTSITKLVGMQDSSTQLKRSKGRRRTSNVQVHHDTAECKDINIDIKEAKEWLSPGHQIELRNGDTENMETYRIDNQHLNARTSGMAYRHSKKLDDKAENDKFVSWGAIVMGHDEGDGWLRVGQYYLPMMLNNARVIVPESAIDSDRCMCSTNDRQVHRETDMLQSLPHAQLKTNTTETPKLAPISDTTCSTSTGSGSEVARSSISLEPREVEEWLWPRRVRVHKNSFQQEQVSQVVEEIPSRRSSKKDLVESNEDVNAEVHSPTHIARLDDNGSIAHAATAVNPDALTLANRPLHANIVPAGETNSNMHAVPQPQAQIQSVQQQPQPHALVPGIHVAPVPTYRMVMVELELDADNPYHMKAHEVEHIPRHLGWRQNVIHGSHDGPILSIHETPGHPVFHAYLIVREPVASPAATTITASPDTGSNGSLTYPSPPSHDMSSSGQFVSTPGNAPPVSQQPTHEASQVAAYTAGMSSASSAALAQFVEQGIIFGSISSVAMEATQIAVTQRSSDQQIGFFVHGSQLAVAAVRGASIGAVGAGLAFMFGPVAPTAILVGYSISRECTDQAMSWNRNQISGNDAVARSLEVLLGATSGVSAAWGAAMILSGLSGATVAAAAGCCGFAGNLGGRRFGKFIADFLVPMSEADRRLFLAYVELGVPPDCTRKELERAFRKAALACHPDKAKNESSKSHAKFARLSAAMDRIRAARGITARPHRNSLSTPLSLQAK